MHKIVAKSIIYNPTKTVPVSVTLEEFLIPIAPVAAISTESPILMISNEYVTTFLYLGAPSESSAAFSDACIGDTTALGAVPEGVEFSLRFIVINQKLEF